MFKRDRYRKKQSLSIKMGAATVMILTVIFALHTYLSYNDLVYSLENRSKSEVSSVVAMARIAVVNEDGNIQPPYAQRVCDNIITFNPNVLEASFYAIGENGKLTCIASNDDELIGTEAGATYAAITSKGNTAWENELDSGEHHYIEVLSPLIINGIPKMVFGVRMDLSSRDVELKNYMFGALIYAFIGIISIALLLYILIKIEIYRPLRQLLVDIHEVSGGNLNRRLPINRTDELGELSRELDVLVLKLRDREKDNLWLSKNLKDKWAKAEEKSRIDALTGIENRRSLESILDDELKRAAQQGSPVSLLFCDLDKFKAFNDTHGHLLGDKALIDVAAVFKKTIRPHQTAARYGGEEFAIVLPGTDAAEAVEIAKRIKANISTHPFTTKTGRGYMTISIGVASYPVNALDKERLIATADHAMYESKKSGGDLVTLSAESPNAGPQKAS